MSRRAAEKEIAEGRVKVNGKIARASYDVKQGDIIAINMGQKPLKVEVINVTEYATKENAADNYRIVEWKYLSIEKRLVWAVFFSWRFSVNKPPVLPGELKSFSLSVFRRETFGEAMK